MSADSLRQDVGGSGPAGRDVIPREYLRAIAIWSLIPAYLFAGGALGYAADRWLDTFPFGVGIGLVLALALSVRDMMRLRSELGLEPKR